MGTMMRLMVLAAVAALGCGGVDALAMMPDGSAGASGGSTAGATGSAGTTATAGSAGATGNAGSGGVAIGGTTGQAGRGGESGAAVGSAGRGGAGALPCTGPAWPVPPAGDCTANDQCLSGTCAGGFCSMCTSDPSCTAEKDLYHYCVDDGWIPTAVQDCSATAAPMCLAGFRCLNCGTPIGRIKDCWYDRDKTSVCVTSCGECS